MLILDFVVLSLSRGGEARGLEPEQVQIRYGEGVLESMPRETIRRLASLTRVSGLPVVLPEDPGLHPGAVEVTLRFHRSALVGITSATKYVMPDALVDSW